MSVGFPANVKLNQWAFAAQQVFGGSFYHVGSSVRQKNTRDVDVVCMLPDEEFEKLFGSVNVGESDWKWAGLCLAFSEWAKSHTGLNIDFKFQPVSIANLRHKGDRSHLGGMIPLEWRLDERRVADYSQTELEEIFSPGSLQPKVEIPVSGRSPEKQETK